MMRDLGGGSSFLDTAGMVPPMASGRATPALLTFSCVGVGLGIGDTGAKPRLGQAFQPSEKARLDSWFVCVFFVFSLFVSVR